MDRPKQTGKGTDLARMTWGTQAHKQKKQVLLRVPGECGTMSPAREMAQAQGNTHRTTHAGAGRRGGHERAGSHAAHKCSAHAQSDTSPAGWGDPALGGGGWSARAAAPDRSGLGGCCSAQRSGPAGAGSSMCRGSPAAARRRLLCSSGSNSGCHGQVQHGAHPRAARYEAAVVSGTPGLGASQTQCVPLHGTPQPRCLPPPHPTPQHPGCKATPCPCISALGICPQSILCCPPRLTRSGPYCPGAACAYLPCSPLALPKADSQ